MLSDPEHDADMAALGIERLNQTTAFRQLIDQYLNDEVGRKTWDGIATVDERAALQTIFLEGACFDFAAAASELTGWPAYEIQWGTAMPDDPDDCDISDPHYGCHRVVQHPSGRYLDASGWTDMRATLERVNRTTATYQWMGEVDAENGPFDVDFELVKQVVVDLLPCDIEATPETTKRKAPSISM